MKKVTVETCEKRHELIIVAQKSKQNKTPNLGLSFFLDGNLVQSLIVVKSEVQILRFITNDPGTFYNWHVYDVIRSTMVCCSTIICTEFSRFLEKEERKGFRWDAFESNKLRINATDDDTNFLNLILDELDNAIESDFLPIYSLDSYGLTESEAVR